MSLRDRHWGNVLIKPVTDNRNRNFGFIAENKLYQNSGRLVGWMSGNLVVSDAGVRVGEVNGGVVTMYGRSTPVSRMTARMRSLILRPGESVAAVREYKTPKS